MPASALSAIDTGSFLLAPDAPEDMNDALARRLPGPAQGTRAARARHLLITPRLARRPARAPARIILRLHRGRVAQPAQGRSPLGHEPRGPAPSADRARQASSPGTSIALLPPQIRGAG